MTFILIDCFVNSSPENVHEHVQRLVSVVEMATVLEECSTEEQRYLVCFLWVKGSMQSIFIKKCFLFTAISVYRIKRFTTGLRNSLTDVSKIADDARLGFPVENTTETTLQQVEELI
jgi:hypothetical protein